MSNETNTPSLPQEFVGSTGSGDASISIPDNLTIDNSLDEILAFARNANASDVHICTNNPIVLRKAGSLVKQTDDILTPQHVEKMLQKALAKNLFEQLSESGDLETVHTVQGFGRFRLTAMNQRFGLDITARVIPQSIAAFADSGLPVSCEGLTKWAQGMVLITGPAGCGKTTTLSVLIDMINQTRAEHIITVEDPVEVVYDPKESQITQREIGLHTLSQNNALKAALREDPDILVVSELRDLNSIQLAVSAAETGHLVFGTMNTTNAPQTISKLIDSFPPEDQPTVRNMVSESLRGVISQQLIPRSDGSGLIPAFEALIVTPAVSNLIRENKIGQISNVIATGKGDGMVSLDHYLKELVVQNFITTDEARKRTINNDLI